MRNRQRPRGFSLIEVLIAVVVLSTGMLALAALQSTITRNSVAAKARSQAVAAANDVLDLARERASRDENGFENLQSTGLQDWVVPDIARDGGSPQRFQKRLTVTRLVAGGPGDPCSADAPCFRVLAANQSAPNDTVGLKQVDVDIQWVDDAGITQSVRVSDLIYDVPRTAQYGLLQP
ncbi:hypothetical protein C7S18_22760 [Ahniella affigens]|uniref:Type IV pilus modification protein PilV n=1 Tax=Ahniella affigens TaxID=2021234 RepID=A0A2P1PY96_9GAMM|nr:prepilin-type N-terminal cleavage/methylation domain-containing protein [Ahniella affigens]AVP99822.1 hypothetical protein C7S18_22760 [Ahniella affigens]